MNNIYDVNVQLPHEHCEGLSQPILAISKLANGYDYNFVYYDLHKKEWINVEDMQSLHYDIAKPITHWMNLPEPK